MKHPSTLELLDTHMPRMLTVLGNVSSAPSPYLGQQAWTDGTQEFSQVFHELAKLPMDAVARAVILSCQHANEDFPDDIRSTEQHGAAIRVLYTVITHAQLVRDICGLAEVDETQTPLATNVATAQLKLGHDLGTKETPGPLVKLAAAFGRQDLGVKEQINETALREFLMQRTRAVPVRTTKAPGQLVGFYARQMIDHGQHAPRIETERIADHDVRINKSFIRLQELYVALIGWEPAVHRSVPLGVICHLLQTYGKHALRIAGIDDMAETLRNPLK